MGHQKQRNSARNPCHIPETCAHNSSQNHKHQGKSRGRSQPGIDNVLDPELDIIVAAHEPMNAANDPAAKRWMLTPQRKRLVDRLAGEKLPTSISNSRDKINSINHAKWFIGSDSWISPSASDSHPAHQTYQPWPSPSLEKCLHDASNRLKYVCRTRAWAPAR
jgi:hypothetical protein